MSQGYTTSAEIHAALSLIEVIVNKLRQTRTHALVEQNTLAELDGEGLAEVSLSGLGEELTELAAEMEQYDPQPLSYSEYIDEGISHEAAKGSMLGLLVHKQLTGESVKVSPSVDEILTELTRMGFLKQ